MWHLDRLGVVVNGHPTAWDDPANVPLRDRQAYHDVDMSFELRVASIGALLIAQPDRAQGVKADQLFGDNDAARYENFTRTALRKHEPDWLAASEAKRVSGMRLMNRSRFAWCVSDRVWTC